MMLSPSSVVLSSENWDTGVFGFKLDRINEHMLKCL